MNQKTFAKRLFTDISYEKVSWINISIRNTILLITFLSFTCNGFCEMNEDIVIKNQYYSLIINKATGSLSSMTINGRKYISKENGSRPLIEILLRDNKGTPTKINTAQTPATFTREDKANSILVTLTYLNIGKLPVNAKVTITCPKNEALTYWNLELENNSEYYIDHLDFPPISIPNDLAGKGGDSYVFRPGMEGIEISNLDDGPKSWFGPGKMEFPQNPWGGFYPASINMQFTAYYNKDGGLYIGAHDDQNNLKGIEIYKKDENTATVLFRLFPEGFKKGIYKVPYPIVIGSFQGDWYDAASIYRSWFEKSAIAKKLVKLKENKKIPGWIKESPVAIGYPVRGTKDLGDATPNEYYPFTNGLPVIEKYQKAFNSPILVTLMQWEGSAPWAPPYNWPPYGGETNLIQYSKQLHEKGNYLGLYCSGVAYTTKSNLDTTFNMEKEFKEQHVEEAVTITPNGKINPYAVCVGQYAQRWGHDLCVAHPFSKQVMYDQVKSILASKSIDYLQLFDQNVGGNGYMCYSDKHGHPVGPGKWQANEMIEMYESIQGIIDSAGQKMLFGCEGAAGEPFTPYLLMNEARSHFGLGMGKPVPAYAFLFHEYINNYMGNQTTGLGAYDVKKSPFSLSQRLAYGFISGDILTVTLVDHGDIGFGWNVEWYKDKPDQETTINLVKNLNEFRRGVGKEYLVFGRLEKPYEVSGGYEIPLERPWGGKLSFNSFYTTKWKSDKKKDGQVIANYTEKSQQLTLHCNDMKNQQVIIKTNNNKTGEKRKIDKEGKLTFEVPGLSALLIEFN